MPDTKISDLQQVAQLSLEDLMVIAEQNGTPVSKSATMQQIADLLKTNGVLVTKSANQSIPDGVPTALLWDVEQYDDLGIHAPGSSGLIVPLGVSRIRLCAGLAWAVNSNGTRELAISNVTDPGDNAGIGADSRNGVAVSRLSHGVSTSPILATPGDEYQVFALQNSGAPLDIFGAPNGATFFSMEIVR